MGVWECCAESELHRRSGLQVLNRRKIILSGDPFGQLLRAEQIGSTALRGGYLINRHLRLKPQAESCSPCGTSPTTSEYKPLPIRPNRQSETNIYWSRSWTWSEAPPVALN